MNTQKTAQRHYTVTVYDEPGAPGMYRFTFVPKRPQQARPAEGAPKPAPQYVLSVKGHPDEMVFNWVSAPPREAVKEELEQVACQRVAERIAWIHRVADLVKTVEGWAKELGWSTKRIDKRIEDSRLCNHKAAGLVMQQDAVRVLLEPISATAPGSDGLVDLYLMPGYDDIASLYHRDDGWHVHYVFPTQKAVAGIKEGESRLLSKKTLGVALDEMKQHAG
jgi:hypothetical protein